MTTTPSTNENPFGGLSLEFHDNKKDSKLNCIRLSDALNNAGIKLRKAKDKANKRACDA